VDDINNNNTDDLNLAIAHAITEARIRVSLSQKELARKTGISQELIAQLEKGKLPEIRILEELAAAVGSELKVSLESLPSKSDQVKHDDFATSLIHNALHEFAITRSPRSYGLLPLLNSLSLRIQKPLVFVLFYQAVESTPSQWTAEVPWEHSFQRPKYIRDKFNAQITEKIEEYKNQSETDRKKCEWLIDPNTYISKDSLLGKLAIRALGVFYLDIVLEDKRASKGHLGEYLSSKSRIYPLTIEDLHRLNDVMLSVMQHRASEDGGGDSHRRHIEKYIQASTQLVPELFSNQLHSSNNQEYVGEPLDVRNLEEHLEILQPVIEGLDEIYRTVRGGKPGEYNEKLDTMMDSGSPIIWGRYRDAVKGRSNIKPKGIRPPNIGFYLYLRTPRIRESDEPSFRIVPR